MIKLGNKELTPKGYSKVMKGNSLVWQKELGRLVYHNTGLSTYYISVGSPGELDIDKNYRFVTNVDGEYSIIISGSHTRIKDNDVFQISGIYEMQITHTRYREYDIKIYETKEKATIVI